MFAIVVLGASQSGKTTLARKCLTEHSTHLPLRPDSPRAFHVVTPARTQDTQILDPKPTARRSSMGRELARRTVAAALLVLPRDTTDATAAAGVAAWADFARQCKPCPQLAVVVTKLHAENAPLPSHQFEQLALESMRASGVDRLFYTDAQTSPPEDLRGWLGDVVLRATTDARRAEQRSPCWGPAEAPSTGALPLLADDPYSDKHTQRSCDHCVVA